MSREYTGDGMRVEPKPASSDVSGDYPAVPSPQQFSAVSPTIAVRFLSPHFCSVIGMLDLLRTVVYRMR